YARGAERFVEHDIATLGAQRHPHRIVEDVDATQHAVAGIDRKFDVFSSHCLCSSDVDFGSAALGGLLLGGAAAFDHAHDIGLLHDQEILTVDLDCGAGPFAEQHGVADLEVDRDQLAAFVAAARAHGDDFALRGLLFRSIGNDDAAGSLFLGIDALDDNAVVKRTKLHG